MEIVYNILVYGVRWLWILDGESLILLDVMKVKCYILFNLHLVTNSC